MSNKIYDGKCISSSFLFHEYFNRMAGHMSILSSGKTYESFTSVTLCVYIYEFLVSANLQLVKDYNVLCRDVSLIVPTPVCFLAYKYSKQTVKTSPGSSVWFGIFFWYSSYLFYLQIIIFK